MVRTAIGFESVRMNREESLSVSDMMTLYGNEYVKTMPVRLQKRAKKYE